jgi:hypothetical protein
VNSGPALIAHGSLDLTQEIQIQIQPVNTHTYHTDCESWPVPAETKENSNLNVLFRIILMGEKGKGDGCLATQLLQK